MIFLLCEIKRNLSGFRKMEAFEKRERLFYLPAGMIRKMIEESDPYCDCTAWMKYELMDRGVEI